MIFSEKMKAIPQPRRADLWNEYRVLCTALALQVTLKRENRPPTEEELLPLKTTANNANAILSEYGFDPSFFPESEDFFNLLINELSAVRSNPARGD
ncbi:MAG: hypothetical protein J6B86_07150 [Clostridia bacterium]|nr:hypothetical protein [Clostridia bacterium]